MDDPDQKVFIWCQAITPGAAVKALDATERNPWLPGCGDAPQEECPSRGRLVDLPGDSKLLVAQVRQISNPEHSFLLLNRFQAA